VSAARTRRDRQRLLVEERRDLHQFLRGLTPEQWEAPSLCGDWAVLDVAAHLSSFLGVTPLGLFTRAARFGTSTRGANARSTAAWARTGNAAVTAALDDRGRLGLGYVAPGWALFEAVVHHQDMRRPLGAPRTIPEDRLRLALTVLCRLPTGTGGYRRSRVVTLWATDIEWRQGTGPEITGPAEAILMALAGRADALKDLDGPGVDVLGDSLSRRRR
jgi:uncharacterized protein (TIGR03083 family)